MCTFLLFNTLCPTDLSPHLVLNQSETQILGSRISAVITGMENAYHVDKSWRE